MGTLLSRCLVAVALAAVPLAAAPAQTPPELARQYDALYAAWESGPLAARNVTFVAEKPASFGQFTPAASSRFTGEEPLRVYGELVGYSWVKRDDGLYHFGVSIDLLIKTKDGQTLVSKPNFLVNDQTSRNRNLEYYMNMTISLTNAPPGEYVLEWHAHDRYSAKAVVFETPFTIVGQ